MQRTNDLLERTKKFALATIHFCEGLPKDETSRVLGRQLLRSGTSVGANYRAAHRAKSKADFISKMCIASKEARETHYWLRLVAASNLLNAGQIKPCADECNELIAILTSIIKKMRAKRKG